MRFGLCACLVAGWCFVGRTAFAEDVAWKRVQLDAAFRSEGVAAADVNHDGKLDVLAGDVWYEAPDWTMHEIRKPGKFVAGVGYSNSFANFTHDINGDGWEDFIMVGFPGAPFHWYENPKNKPGPWKEHLIWHSICNETPLFLDLTGNGKPEIIFGSQPEAQMGFTALPTPEKADTLQKWNFQAVSKKGNPQTNGSFKYYHGLGVGDVNRDGRNDVVIPHGWWEQPSNNSESPWTFHALNLSKPGEKQPLKAANIHVDDFDQDGDQDLVMSSAHTFGVWWFENVEGQYKYHLIDESYSQTHAMEYEDINGDGVKDLITGKRFYAHNGKDPGGKDPVGMFWYEVKKGKNSPPKFIRHEIAAGKDTGLGTQFLIKDMNNDKRLDIVLSNKKGVNILFQQTGNLRERATD